VIEGQFFDGRSSTPHSARLDLGRDAVLRVSGIPEPREAPLATVQISDRLGRTPRRIRFTDGAVFETLDNDGMDAALAALDHRSFSGRVDRWERRWSIAVGALVAVAAISAAFVRWGIPLLANIAAHTLPAAVDRSLGTQGLEILDRSFLEPSKLPARRKEDLRIRFREMTVGLADGHDYRLELRGGKHLGANAFALPDGIVVMTDELVALAENDEEIDAVLAHEIGHVRGRHALRMILQSTGVAAITLTVFGDVSSISGMAASIPAVLLNAKHSREFEKEADGFARTWLREHGIPQHRFDDLLCRLEKDSPASPDMSYLGSHPPTHERANCAAPAAEKAAIP
jgi:Zn-dependent protease with chaperone function